MDFQKKLQKLFDDYLSTLTNPYKDEWYGTKEGLAAKVFDDFLDWFEKTKVAQKSIVNPSCSSCPWSRHYRRTGRKLPPYSKTA